MDPRTFLRPPALAVRAVPEPGDQARSLPVRLEPDRAAIVAFLRHTGCPFAERTMQLLREHAETSPAVQWIAVSHASETDTERWRREIGGSGRVLVISDPSRRSYAEWGLGRTSLGHFLGRDSLAAVASLAREGVRNRHPAGTRWQSAGTFALDGHGTIRWSTLPAHAGDLPDIGSALTALA